jgi:nucleotide-binding universal stress UspA family protein
MPPHQNILCPIDFSQGSVAALEEALLLAEAFDGKIELLHVWQLPMTAFVDGVIWPEGTLKRLGEDVETAARGRMRRLLDSLPEAQRARVTEHVVLGDPASTIIDRALARSADLIVMGTHGRRGPSRFLMGSVAERVVRHAQCPVLTVRGGAGEARQATPR